MTLLDDRVCLGFCRCAGYQKSQRTDESPSTTWMDESSSTTRTDESDLSVFAHLLTRFPSILATRFPVPDKKGQQRTAPSVVEAPTGPSIRALEDALPGSGMEVDTQSAVGESDSSSKEAKKDEEVVYMLQSCLVLLHTSGILSPMFRLLFYDFDFLSYTPKATVQRTVVRNALPFVCMLGILLWLMEDSVVFGLSPVYNYFSLSTTRCSPNIARPGNHARHQRTIPARKPAEGQAGSGKVDGNIAKGKKKGATNGSTGKETKESSNQAGTMATANLIPWFDYSILGTD
ncbi:MAG: hypothetical protein NXY57DRAFT_1043818 [Lentinula lateritia]|nr:MAG: hypothetical protein NXY57DRAFT_1043818 [Lentinula lateritia]